MCCVSCVVCRVLCVADGVADVAGTYVPHSVPTHSLVVAPHQEKMNQRLVTDEKSQLLFSKKGRRRQYEPYTLNDYKQIKPRKYMELGCLQPNLNTTAHLKKVAAAEKRKSYAEKQRARNAARLRKARQAQQAKRDRELEFEQQHARDSIPPSNLPSRDGHRLRSRVRLFGCCCAGLVCRPFACCEFGPPPHMPTALHTWPYRSAHVWPKLVPQRWGGQMAVVVETAGTVAIILQGAHRRSVERRVGSHSTAGVCRTHRSISSDRAAAAGWYLHAKPFIVVVQAQAQAQAQAQVQVQVHAAWHSSSVAPTLVGAGVGEGSVMRRRAAFTRHRVPRSCCCNRSRFEKMWAMVVVVVVVKMVSTAMGRVGVGCTPTWM